MHLMLAGDWDSGQALVSRAMDLNPCHPSWHYLVFSLHTLHHHRPKEALTALSPFAAVEFFPFQINLAVIHAQLGRQEEARRCLAGMYRLWPEAVGKNRGGSGLLVSLRGSGRYVQIGAGIDPGFSEMPLNRD